MSDGSRSPFFVVRKRAPYSGTAFDLARVDMGCPKCNKQSPQPIAELVVNDTVDCLYCGTTIDISDERRKAELFKLANELKEVKFLRGS